MVVVKATPNFKNAHPSSSWSKRVVIQLTGMEVIRNDQSNQSLFEKPECIANFSVISPGLLETPNVIINI